VDELRQRLDRQEDQSGMSDQRRQLDQTRDEVQRAGEAAAQGDAAQALAAGTRAQRQFQDMRDQLHRQNSSQFSDELRDMRAAARDLADREEAIAQKLDPQAQGGQPKRLSDESAATGPARDLEEQKQRMTDLVNRAKQVSQQAEASEPLLAEKLYDSLRKLGQDDTGTVKQVQDELLGNGLLTSNLNDRINDDSVAEGAKSLDLAAALLKENYLPQAREVEQRARAGIDELKTGVERAAESVIGDDTEALKLAQSELDAVTDQVKREAAGGAPPGAPGAAGQSPARSEQASSGGAPGASPPAASGSPGQGGQPGGASPTSGSALAGGDSPAAAGNAGAPGAAAGGGDPLGIDNLLNGGAAGGGGGGGRAAAPGAPITGTGYGSWSDRLREIEEIVDAPDLRNAVAAARERARLVRQDFTRNHRRPDWAAIDLEIVKPLLEVRDHISDELARRASKDSLVPLDRDPVPNRYAESVRKYYEELGKDK
jgi:hypothetical protein